MPELTRTTAELPRSAAQVGPAEYQRVITGVREAVARAVPPGAIVLVVSRGDEELVRLPNHRGWHFPRTAGGEYVGYHPEDSGHAIAHLEELRSTGAGFLVFPRTAFWWFEYYGDLAEYLRRNARRVAEDPDACVIFALEGMSILAMQTPSARRPEATTAAGIPSRLGNLVEALLPEDCSVAVAIGENEKMPALGGRGVWRFALPDPALGLDPEAGASVVGELDLLAAAGVRYLVVPRDLDDLIQLNPVLRHHMMATSRVVTRQRYLGAIYSLRPSGPASENGDFGREGSEEQWR